jgi:glycosyltransferase involved in cell wall biosynthesis
MPQVSIITALHNKGPYIAETIRSVLAQTRSDWELIVVENGSTDNGPDVVRQFMDTRIRLVVSPKCGPGAARNFGLALATGAWVLFLDADDLIAPNYLEERLGLLRNQPQADLLVGCWEEFKDGSSEPAVIRKPAAHGGTDADLANAAIAHAPWALHAALVRKSRILEGRLWSEEMDGLPSEDTAFWFPVVYEASILWSENAGALYRVQTETSRNEIKDVKRWMHAVLGVIRHNVDYLKVRNIRPNQQQCASIVRVLESTYRLCLSRQSRAEAKLALEEANNWLKICPASSLAITVRKTLGLRLFNLLRYGVMGLCL